MQIFTMFTPFPGSDAYEEAKHNTKVMMKLLIQGTSDGIRSSRKISKATKENHQTCYCRDYKISAGNGHGKTRKHRFGTKIKASASNFSLLSKEELDEIKEAIDMELQKGIELDELEEGIYGDTDPDKLPEPFKDIKG